MSQAGSAPKPATLAIVGGGIAGLCLAIGLKHNGIPFHLYEAAQHFSEIGAGVSLHPCAIAAMKLIDPELYAGFNRHVTRNATLKDHWFRFLWGVDAKGSTSGPKAGDLLINCIGTAAGTNGGQNSVHRAHFLDELVKLVPDDCVSFGKRIVRVADEGTHVQLEFEDGTTADHTAVIGCDGIKSHVRESLLGKDYNAKFTGKYAYRGIIPMDQAVALLGDEQARNSHMHIGYGGHVLSFPIAHGKTMNVVAFNTKADGKWTDDRWVVRMDKADLEKDFREWSPTVQKIVSLMQKPDVWALFDHPPAPTYAVNRVALLGDAAHASTPHQGSGAGMAIEDAFVMSRLLGLTNNNDKDFALAFSVYDELRRVRSQKLVTTSRQAGLLWDLEKPDVKDDPEKLRQDLGTRFNWIWNHDVEQELSHGKQLYAERKRPAVR